MGFLIVTKTLIPFSSLKLEELNISRRTTWLDFFSIKKNQYQFTKSMEFNSIIILL